MKRIVLSSLLMTLAALAGCASAGTSSQPQTTAMPRVTMNGHPVTLGHAPPVVGQEAPQFSAVANDMSTYHFTPGHGEVYIIASVPSLDTKVCSIETRRFNQEASHLGADVHILTISMDLPFAQKRWCGAEGIERVKTLSDARDQSFAQAYGLRMEETGLLARAVFVIGPDGKITYRQIVPEIGEQPNYSAALGAAARASQKAQASAE